MTEVAQIYGLLFPNVPFTFLFILTKMGWATNWAFFQKFILS
jgi:hypothetical protein